MYHVYKEAPARWAVSHVYSSGSYFILARYRTRKQAITAARLLAGPCGHVVQS